MLLSEYPNPNYYYLTYDINNFLYVFDHRLKQIIYAINDNAWPLISNNT